MTHMRVGKSTAAGPWTKGALVLGLGVLCPGAMAQVRYSYAQAPAAQGSEAPAKPSGSVTEWSDPSGRSPSTRVVEKHSQSGGKEVITRTSGNLPGGGAYQPGGESEEETVRIDSKTVRVVRREFATDSDGRRKVVGVTEEQKKTLPGGGQTVVRTISRPDLNSGFQVVRRDLEETTTTSPGATETRTTVLMPGAEAGLAPREQIVRVERKQGDVEKVQTTHSLPNGNGGWQVSKIEDKLVKAEGKNSRTTQERVYQRDAQQNLSLSKEVLSKNWTDGTGQEHETRESYSSYSPGMAVSGNGGLTLDQRLRIVRRTSPDGSQQTEQQQEECDPNAPGSALRLAQKTLETATTSRDGSVTKQGTVQSVDANGNTRTILLFATRPLK
jgi:hypothetical protein